MIRKQPAWIIAMAFLGICLLITSDGKVIQKIVALKEMDSSTRTMFITKFDFGIGNGQANPQRDHQFPPNMTFGLLEHSRIAEFKAAGENCEARKEMYRYLWKIKWDDYIQAVNMISVTQDLKQEIYYIQLFNCDVPAHQFKNIHEGIDMKMRLMNNGSHFGEDQNLFVAYIAMVVIWLAVLIKFGIPILRTFSARRPDTTRMVVYCAVLVLGVSYFYRVLHLVVYYSDGRGIVILDIFYIILKNVTEGVFVTVIISIAWGWSIVHLRHDQTYIITGTLSALINIAGLVLNALSERMEDEHHQYQSTTGMIIFTIRVILFGIFIVGVLRSMATSAGKTRDFLGKYGLVGTAYLLAWPAIVVFSQLFLPNYMHHEVITFVEEGVHMIASVLLCQMLSYPESTYRKVSMKEDDVPLGTFDRRRK